jgi:quercetin dioxygenase-like cupin family protein
MLQYLVRFDELEWEQPMQGVRCKIYREGNRQLRLVEYTQKMPVHWCARGHYGMILDGEFEIEYTNDRFVYRSGDGVFIPEGTSHRHRAKALTDRVRVIFIEDVE